MNASTTVNVFAGDDTTIEAHRLKEANHQIVVRIGVDQAPQVFLTVPAARRLRFELACVLMDIDVAHDTDTTCDTEGCGHSMMDHDGEGCTGWTNGRLCLCEEPA